MGYHPIKLDEDLFMTLQYTAGRETKTAIEDLAAKVCENLSDLATAIDASDLQIEVQVRVEGNRGTASVRGYGSLECYRDLDHYEQVEAEAEAEMEDA